MIIREGKNKQMTGLETEVQAFVLEIAGCTRTWNMSSVWLAIAMVLPKPINF